MEKDLFLFLWWIKEAKKKILMNSLLHLSGLCRVLKDLYIMDIIGDGEMYDKLKT
jgi:hypothetical protein